MRRSAPLMGTIVTIDVVDRDARTRDSAAIDAGVDRAFEWFRQVEATCTRFDPSSELMRLCQHAGSATPVSEILFAAAETALAVAAASDGAFDPTIGRAMETLGFNRHYADGRVVDTPSAMPDATFRDVDVDARAKTITIARPLVLDLSAVAKGLAIDLAARELQPFEDFVIDAGGDLYASGVNDRGEPWRIGIRHPRVDREVIATLKMSNAAVCTSGDYERKDVASTSGHIVDPRRGTVASETASATAIASSAMLADAMSTAAFVMGGAQGLSFLERHGVDGLIVTTSLDLLATEGMSFRHSLNVSAPILPHA